MPATRTFELSKLLASAGWEVTVVACRFNHYTFEYDTLGDADESVTEVQRDGVRWVFIKSSRYSKNGLSRFRNMLGYAWVASRWARGQSGPDIVVGTTVHPFAAEAARRLARRFNAQYYYEITDLWPESLVDLGHIERGSILYRLMRRLERYSLEDAVGVIGIMPNVPQYARDFHSLQVSRFCYVPNGVHLMDVDEAGPSSRRSPIRGQLAYAGGFAPAHGLSAILDAADHLNQVCAGEFEIVLYGDGPDRKNLEAEVLKRHLPNVRFAGLVPKADLRTRLADAEICLCTGQALPIHRYGISFNKLFDYFAAERPIVYAVDSGNDPVASADAGLSVPAGDGAAIASATREIHEMAAVDRQRLGTNGLNFVRSQHAFPVLAERLDKFLRDGLGSTHS
ncbi:glycosyltransferase family 4 protein [Nocardioides aquiterrae]|uniref:glycosyltransferase family 4 protein n=1 Tax=Nocardioides aquiterrae TaxID=203799 RepID=UPI0031D45403